MQDPLNWLLTAGLILLLLVITWGLLWVNDAFKTNRIRKPLTKRAPIISKEEFAEELILPISFPPEPTAKPELPIIPWKYGKDRMALMVRDPNWIFAYWEISAAKQQEFSTNYGEEAWQSSRSVLRVYDITGVESFNGANANDYTDISIKDNVDSWHIDMERPNSTLCVDLGRIFPDGTFVTLLRSNTVKTPALAISNLLDEEWMWLEGIYKDLSPSYLGSSSIKTPMNSINKY